MPTRTLVSGRTPVSGRTRVTRGGPVYDPETAGRVYYVSPSGSDSNNGLTEGAAFLTVDHARSVVAAYKTSPGLPAGGISVRMLTGVYPQTTVLRFNSTDSGEATKPIVYKAHDGHSPRIIGGKVIASNQATLVTAGDAGWSRICASARGNLYKIDLTAQGMAVGTYGSIIDVIDKNTDIAPVEFCVNGVRQMLPQYPKKGYTSGDFMATASTLSGTTISYASANEARIETWTNETDAWMCVFANAVYSMEYGQISAINTGANTFTLTNTAGVTASTIGTGKPYFVRNVLEELTQAGEWYLHKASGTLYFWPTVDPATAELMVSTYNLDVCRCYGASYLGFKGISFEMGRRAGLRIDGTTPTEITVTDCTFKNNGTDAMAVNGTNFSIRKNFLYGSNCSGIDIYGGVRASLTHAGINFAKNSVHDNGYWKPTAKNAITCRGVGYTIVKNEVYNFDGMGIALWGNNHLVQFNKIHDGCRMVNDAGYIYTIGTWRYRGHTVRWNHLYGFLSSNVHGTDMNGIYIDDCTSDCKIVANIVDGTPGYGYRLSGGRDVKFTSNIAIGCGTAFQYDNRALSRINNTDGDSWNLLQRLTDDSVSYQTGVWLAQYPKLAAIFNDFTVVNTIANRYTQPLGSIITRNCAYNCGLFQQHYDYASTATELEYIGTNLINNDPMMTYGSGSAYDPSSPALAQQGFIDFPYGEVGTSSADEVLTNTDWYDPRVTQYFKYTTAKYWDGGKYVTYNSTQYLLVNLVANGSFESAISPWATQGSPSTGADPYEGSVSMHVTDANGRIQDIQVKASEKLHICGWVHLTSFTAGSFSLGAFDYNSVSNLVWIGTATVAAYAMKSVEKVASAATASVVGGIRLRAYGSGGSVLVGDVDAIMVFDKTAVFGAGTEPTTAQMDTIIAGIT